MDYDNVRKQNLDYFTKTLEEAPDEHHAVAQSKISHLKRFEKMLDLGDFQGKRILDIGCGIGGFYDFLQEKGITCDYTGIDINTNMIEQAKKRLPALADRFFLFDILEEKWEDKSDDKLRNVFGKGFDYAFSVGPLNLKFAPIPETPQKEGWLHINMDLTMRFLEEMHRLADIGSALSMTSIYTRKPNDETYYYDPADLLTHTSKFCTNAKIDHTYLPHDFTVFCYKKDLYSF